MNDFIIENPTHQQIFDYAYLSLKIQGCKSFEEGTNRCKYFYKKPSGEEIRCAIGHLIPKQVAKVWALHVGSIDSLTEANVKAVEGSIYKYTQSIRDSVPKWMLLDENKHFLTQLQVMHDRCGKNMFIDDFESQAKQFATCWELTVPEVPATV